MTHSGLREVEIAILKNDCEALDAFIAQGLDVNSTSDIDNWNLLHIALVPVERPPMREVVEHLIRVGVNVNARDRRLWTPLHFAVRTRDSEVVQLLIQAGAEIEPANDEKITPLHLSVIRAPRKIEITRMLLEAGADADADHGAGTVRNYLNIVSGPDIGEFRRLVGSYPRN
jgi:ankyrin repeat protein